MVRTAGAGIERAVAPMTAIKLVSAMALGTCCLGATTGYCGGGPPRPNPATPRDFAAATLAKIIPGVTTAVQVQALLGRPWHETVFGSGSECPPKPFNGKKPTDSAARNPDQPKAFDPYGKGPAVDAWDYRGRDSAGAYVIRIEFDTNYITYLVAKIRANGTGVATVEQPPATADKP
jgi:hypothetical protein